MKMMTVPALPFSEASECSLPSASGSVKSGMTAPMATPALASGAAKANESARLVAHSASAANANESTRRSATAESFFITLPELLLPRLEVDRQLHRELADGRQGVLRLEPPHGDRHLNLPGDRQTARRIDVYEHASPDRHCIGQLIQRH